LKYYESVAKISTMIYFSNIFVTKYISGRVYNIIEYGILRQAQPKRFLCCCRWFV